MGIRRAKKSGIEHSRKLHVVYESPHSCDQSWIFFALDRLSHPKLCFWLYQLSYGCTQYDNRRLSFAVSPFHCRGKKEKNRSSSSRDSDFTINRFGYFSDSAFSGRESKLSFSFR